MPGLANCSCRSSSNYPNPSPCDRPKRPHRRPVASALGEVDAAYVDAAAYEANEGEEGRRHDRQRVAPGVLREFSRGTRRFVTAS